MSKFCFSIVTICYNSENEIRETMESVINQDYRPIEYVIIDGASEDRTNEIIKDTIRVNDDKGIKFVYQSEKDKGISDAFNKGISKSTGDVIGLINSGDTLMPHALKKIFEAFEKNKNADVIYGNTLCVDKDNHLRYLRRIPDKIDPRRFKYDGLGFTHQSAFVKKEVYDRCGLYDVSFKYVMDSELFCKFAEEGVRFAYLDETTVSMLAGGISSFPSLALVKENIRVAQKYGGSSKATHIIKWIIGLPRHYIVRLLKKNPKVWNKIIGEKRRNA